LYFSYVQKHIYEQAITEKAWVLSGGNRQKAEDTARRMRAAYHARGEQGIWQEQTKILTNGSSSSFDSPFWMAESYIRLGQTDSAFAWLTRAADAKHPGTYTLKVEPLFDSLRSDPRFLELMRRLRLPP
jgi:hypothetical protein